MKGLIGKKLGMTRVFDEEGRSIPVTVLECGPCRVTQVKTSAKEGYDAVQLGFGERKDKHVTRPMQGHFEKSGDGSLHLVKEFRTEAASEFELGQTVTVDIFEGIDRVNVTGVTKGRGFAGVVKRWGFGGGKETHGSHHHRHPGTIGMCATPSRVFKGAKMPGRYGNDRQTVLNMRVVRVDTDNNLLFVRGSVPGAKNGFILVQQPRR